MVLLSTVLMHELQWQRPPAGKITFVKARAPMRHLLWYIHLRSQREMYDGTLLLDIIYHFRCRRRGVHRGCLLYTSDAADE